MIEPVDQNTCASTVATNAFEKECSQEVYQFFSCSEIHKKEEILKVEQIRKDPANSYEACETPRRFAAFLRMRIEKLIRREAANSQNVHKFIIQKETA
jgi:hypothetical protein